MNCFDAFMKEKGGASFGGSMYVVVVEVVQIKGLLVIFFMVKKCYMSSDIVSQFPLILSPPILKKEVILKTVF